MHLSLPLSPSFAEFSFETNAPPVGGYLESDRLTATSGVDTVQLKSVAWTDDFDDLPMSYVFGYAHGWHEVLSTTR